MATLTNLNDVKRTLAIASNVNGTLQFDKNLDDVLIQQFIEDASDYFSVETGNNYYGTNGTLTLDVTQRYVSCRKLFFRDDVLRSITRIECDGVGTLTSSDWITMPKNSNPYYGVELRIQAWSYSDSPLGAIKVIGALGKNAAGQPSARVHLAVTRLASWLYQTRDTRGTVQFTSETAQQGSDTPPNEVIQTIEKEKRHQVTA